MDMETIKSRLTKEFGYPSKGADTIAHQLLQLDPRLYNKFADWWESGNVPVIEIEEYTLKRLMNEHGMNPIASFLTLDWLLRDPEKAKSSLEKGHDHVK